MASRSSCAPAESESGTTRSPSIGASPTWRRSRCVSGCRAGSVRVALVCDWFLPRMGGIELHLRDLALALRKRGLDARIVTTTRGPDVVHEVPVHRVRAALAPS